MKLNTNELGRLKKVELREAWESESGDFTPWLAQEDNIALLGDTIGMDLEVESQEKSVGPFRADILCKDTSTDNWVLVENQLERTDHRHLGQLMTYAAGLNAVTIVWIADQFTDEHRASLDWLNEITTEEIQFFGLEVELWRIGKSAIAPKFNIVSKPNQWIKPSPTNGPMTDTKQLQLEYWTAFRERLLQVAPSIRGTKPRPQHWNNFSIGRSDFGLATFANTRDNWISVCLICRRGNAKPHFYLLREQKDEIEKEIGQTLRWRELPEKIESRIEARRKDADPMDREVWNEQHTWLAEKLRDFHETFRGRVRQLNADDYVTDDEDQ